MYIQLESQVINYEHTGEGAPLILLHGNGEDHHIFDELVAAIFDRYEIYALDTRGHGESATPAEYHYTDMADDVANFIEYYDIKKPAILGFSDGGIIALLTAIRHPETVGRLIVCGANTTPKGLKWRTRREIKKDYKKTKSDLIAMMLREPNITDIQLKGIRVPTVVVAGEKDIIAPKHTQYIAETIPGATIHIMEGENHGSYVIHSDKLKSVVKDYIPTDRIGGPR